MKILIITQVFWPDTASTAQHLADIAELMASNRHEVTVFTSRFSYEDPTLAFATRENHKGIQIKRLRNTSFGKSSMVGRLIDFFSFNFLILFQLLKVRRGAYDLFLGMTSPPLISYIGVLIAKWKKIRFCYWTMDLQPELSIASGLISERSVTAKVLSMLGNYTIRHADKIIALDTYMAKYLVKKGALAQNISIIPVWPVMDEVYTGSRMENPFRLANGFGDKTVIMYSGNHAFVHPLDTLLDAALLLQHDPRFLFVFIGGGVRKKDVSDFKKKHSLTNIIQLPYQPRNQIHLSLGSSDIQTVILGQNQVSFTHPNKIYGSMYIGKPILYIGPRPSHITDILDQLPGNLGVNHGEAQALTRQLLDFAIMPEAAKLAVGERNKEYALKRFHPRILKEKMQEILVGN